MPFIPAKDKVLKTWKCKETGFVVTINRYNGGEAKVQIGPRLLEKKNGSRSSIKAGRLSIEDILWLYDCIDEIKDALIGIEKPLG